MAKDLVMFGELFWSCPSACCMRREGGIVRTDRMDDKEGRSCDTAATSLGVCGVIGSDTLKAVVENLNATLGAL